ncbi:MAG: L-seryl-tRNA(Sec) selenium transferase [Pseudomonadales bacterium]|nr:L-seryl-tRNA(Sec) selenium transferase [Pseudomonadales bacterium]MCP5183917.1 L-seryl-tRNA(Sec) selenium transferase [Pseudomonadales bacterium]
MSEPGRHQLPSIERLLGDPAIAALSLKYGREPVKSRLRELQREARTATPLPAWATDLTAYAGRVSASLSSAAYQPVFNLTGTVIHTNLGRAQVSPALWDSVGKLVTRPMNLEYDLSTGSRGHREAAVTERLARLCNAEAATVVNNGAAALLLVLNTLALGRQVPVSRGELIEIGGSFRLPDIMARSGATLLEVGTTNRTRASDFGRVAAQCALLLKVHPSNFHIEGFTETVTTADLARVATAHALPLCVDLGSGALIDLTRFGLPHEPTPAETLADGADLVTFSGDKLLGGVQAGLIVGRADLVRALDANPLKRALRTDKITLALLEATLTCYEQPDTLTTTLPLLRTLTLPASELSHRANAVQRLLADKLADVATTIEPAQAQIGSGALPDQSLPSVCVVLRGNGLDALAARLRRLPVPVVGRIQERALWLDMRGADPLDELLTSLHELASA